MPRIDDSLDQLRVATWFSTLDLCSKYWHVAVDSQDKQKTALTTGPDLLEYYVMANGLFNSLATYERLLEIVLR